MTQQHQQPTVYVNEFGNAVMKYPDTAPEPQDAAPTSTQQHSKLSKAVPALLVTCGITLTTLGVTVGMLLSRPPAPDPVATPVAEPTATLPTPPPKPRDGGLPAGTYDAVVYLRKSYSTPPTVPGAAEINWYMPATEPDTVTQRWAIITNCHNGPCTAEVIRLNDDDTIRDDQHPYTMRLTDDQWLDTTPEAEESHWNVTEPFVGTCTAPTTVGWRWTVTQPGVVAGELVEEITNNDCNNQGATFRKPMELHRVGDLPPALSAKVNS